MPHDDLLTSHQAGLLLNKSARTVQRLGQSGALRIAAKLPGPNGAYLFRRADVESLAARQLAA